MATARPIAESPFGYPAPDNVPTPEVTLAYPPDEFSSTRLAELDCVARAVFDGDKGAAIRWLRDPFLNDLAQMRFRGDVAAAWAWLEPTRRFVTNEMQTKIAEMPDSASHTGSEDTRAEEAPSQGPTDTHKHNADHRARIEGLALILFGGDRASTLAWLLNAHLAALARLLFDSNVDATSEWLLPLREFARNVIIESNIAGADAPRRRRSPSLHARSVSRRGRPRERSSSLVRVSIAPTITSYAPAPTAALMRKEPREDAPHEDRRLSRRRSGPPDNWVPTLDDRGYIDLPPPHELQLHPPPSGGSPPSGNAMPPASLRPNARPPSQPVPSSSPGSYAPLAANSDRRSRAAPRPMLDNPDVSPRESSTAVNTRASIPPPPPQPSQQSPVQRRRPQPDQQISSTSPPKQNERKPETWYRR